jgi:CDP-paratose 2-epimerase
MNVLVTGGVGFIGSHVAEFYAKKGDSVTVVDNLSRAEIFRMDPKISMHNWNYLKANYRNINLIKGDVRHQDVMERLAKNADAVFHTAAQTAVITSTRRCIPQTSRRRRGFWDGNQRLAPRPA